MSSHFIALLLHTLSQLARQSISVVFQLRYPNLKFISLTDSNIQPNTFLDQLAVCDKASLLGTRGITVQAPIKKTNYLNPRSNQNQNLIYIFQFEFPTFILYFEETLLYDQISKTLFWTTLRIVTKLHFGEPGRLLCKPP